VLFGEIIFVSVQSYRTYKFDVLTDVANHKTTTFATCGFPRLMKAVYSLTSSSS